MPPAIPLGGWMSRAGVWLGRASLFTFLATTMAGDRAVPREETPLRIALGTEDYLDDFSLKVGAASYKTGWAEQSDSPEMIRSKIIALGMQKNTTFHFNLSTPRGLVNSPINLRANALKVTTLEYQTVKTFFPGKTTFYVKSGSIYKPLR